MGRLIADTLRQRGIELTVIELKPAYEGDLRDAGIPYLIDDATEEHALLKAGLMQARGSSRQTTGIRTRSLALGARITCSPHAYNDN